MGVAVTKAELIERIAYRFPCLQKRQVREVLGEAFCEIANLMVRGGRIAWPGFGTFRRIRRAARAGRNPRTGRRITVAARFAISFRVSEDLRRDLVERFARQLRQQQRDRRSRSNGEPAVGDVRVVVVDDLTPEGSE
mgnify:CR=1 FL=1